MNAHDCNWIPTGKMPLYCSDCAELIFTEDSLFTIGIHNDSIYYFTIKDGRLGYTYFEGHRSQLSKKMKSYTPFKHHYEIYKDRLTKDSIDYTTTTALLTISSIGRYHNYLKNCAPYGFFIDWSWNANYSCISFKFRYMNTNIKTIKYIDVYFKVTNSVGDIRKTGHFQGTGPLKELESATWEWDTSNYYVAGDASNMNITKVILTYMDNTKKILNQDQLVFE